MLAGCLLRAPRSAAAYEVCVGLEVHAQILSSTKLFSGASAAGGKLLNQLPANAAVALFDAAHPGAMPAVNAHCVRQALRAAVALRARIPGASHFERKHYFYGDLPSGYQITQQDSPIALRGALSFETPRRSPAGKRLRDESVPCVVRIARLQLEQDSGKTVHSGSPHRSLVDLNRAGVALLEIVSSPDLRSADQAGAFLRALQALLRHTGVSDGNMEEGSMRADVNVSVRRAAGTLPGAVVAPPSVATGAPVPGLQLDGFAQAQAGQYVVELDAEEGGAAYYAYAAASTDPWLESVMQQCGPGAASSAAVAVEGGVPLCSPSSGREVVTDPEPFGPRVELKNVSSVRAVEAAVAGEALRQIELLEAGQRVVSETRTFDAAAATSARLRGKEEEVDYRFMREPDIAPLLVSSQLLRGVLLDMPESLAAIRARYVAELGLSRYDAGVLVGEPGAPPFFEATLRAAREAMDELVQPGRGWVAALGLNHEGGGPLGVAQAPPPSPRDLLPKLTCNWVCTELLGRPAPQAAPAPPLGRPVVSMSRNSGASSTRALSVANSFAIDAPRLGELIALVAAGTISGRTGKAVLERLLGGDSSRPRELVAREGLQQQSDEAALRVQCAGVLATPEGRAMAAEVAAGRSRVLGALVARVMEASGGKANPAAVSRLLQQLVAAGAPAAAGPAR